MTILEEARHSLIFIEHDPLLYEDAGEIPSTSPRLCAMLPRRPQSCFTHLEPIRSWREEMTRNADRVFYFDEGPRAVTKLISKAYPKAQKSQTTLEAWT
jgi:hypothetical protein